MAKTLRSPWHEALIKFIIERRKRAGLTQADVAERLGEYQTFVSRLEGGGRRVDVVELLELAEVIGFKPEDALRYLKAVKRR